MRKTKTCLSCLSLVLCALLGPMALAGPYMGHYREVHAKQDGHVEWWYTLNGQKIGLPFWSQEVEACNWYSEGMEWGWLKTDLLLEFVGHETGQQTTTDWFAPQYQDSEWHMYPMAEWEDLGLGPSSGYGTHFPGMNHDTQDIHVVTDMLDWVAGDGSYVLSTDPSQHYYSFTDGISSELPGVYVATEPPTWNPDAPSDSPYHGWESDSWYTGEDMYVCHESRVIPEPSTLAILAIGGLSVFRRWRNQPV